MRLSDRVRAARRSRGLSQSELAVLLRVDRSAVGHWERGEGSAPSTARLFALAKIAGVCGEWLATGSGPMRPSDLREHTASSLALNGEEERLVCAYRSLAGRARVALLKLAESHSKSQASAQSL